MKKNKLLLIVIMFAFIGLSGKLNAQVLQWAQQSTNGYIWYSGMTGHVYGSLNAKNDANNNLIVAGSFISDTFDIGGYNLIQNQPNPEVFIAKYDAVSGNILWLNTAGNVNDNQGVARAICTDAAGNIYVTGNYGGYDTIFAMIFGNDTLRGGGTFLVKYDPNGNQIYARNYGMAEYAFTFSNVCSMSIDPTGNLFIGGIFTCDSIIFGSDTLYNYPSFGQPVNDFLVKFDGTTGLPIWSRSMGGDNWNYLNTVSTDPSGNVFVTGCYASDTFHVGNLSIYNPDNDTTHRYSNLFVAKFDGSGNALWANGYSTAILQPQGSINLGGSLIADAFGNFYFNASFDSGSFMLDTILMTSTSVNQGFTAKFNGTGNVQWVKYIGAAITIIPENSGNVYFSGIYRDSLIIDNITLYDTASGYLAEFNGSGTLISGINLGPAGITNLSANGDMYSIGTFYTSTITFGNFTLNNPYAADQSQETGVYYLAKYLPTSCSTYFSLYPDTTQIHHYIAINYATGTPPIHYTWSWGDGSQDDTTAYPSHTYLNAGIYTICLSIVDSTGCTSSYCDSSYQVMRTSNTMVYVNVESPTFMGIKNIPQPNNVIEIFPNPASNTLNIYQSDNVQNQILIITDVMGNIIYHQLITNSNQSTVDVSGFSNGVYFYQVTNNIETLRGKFVKE